MTIITKRFLPLLLLCMLLCVGVGSAATISKTFGVYEYGDDGQIIRNTDGTFTEIVTGAGEEYVEYTGGAATFGYGATTTSNILDFERRYVATANTSTILSNSTVTAGQFCFRTSASAPTTVLGSLSLSLVGSMPGTPNALATGDYNKFGTVRYATDKTPAGWSTSSMICYDFNAAGIGNVSKVGYTNITMMLANSVDNSTTGYSWASGGGSRYGWYPKDTTTTAYRPYFNFTWTEYEAPPGPLVNLTANFTSDRTTGGYGASIKFTDTSTGVNINNWLWDFGDGNTSTSQNPTFKYNVPGTYTVNLTATNATQTDYERKVNYITIGTTPDSYLNSYTRMIPWLDQGNNGWCMSYAAAYSQMLLRYVAKGTAPSATQEPFTRDVPYVIGGTTVYSDTLPNYSPSMASMFWDFESLAGVLNHDNYTALGEVMKTGYNLQADQITSKYIDAEYFYPQTEAYLNAHRYNPIFNYTTLNDDDETSWNLLKRNISENGVAIILVDTYASVHDNSTKITIPETGEIATIFQNPSGAATNYHYMAAVGYNTSLEQVYVIQSWGDKNGYTKLYGINKTYWTFGNSQQAFLVPKNITINEVLDLTFPVASFTAVPTSGTAPLSVTFNDTSENIPDAWAYARNNLTHTTWELIAPTRNATVSFPSGNWSVNLSASNAYGSNISTQVTWINVTNPIPVAAFSVNATVGTNYGMHVAFTDLSTGSPSSWAWDFGDGGTSTLQNPTYIYDVSRLYNVSLKVTNGYGEYDWENKTDYINLQTDLPNVGAWSHFDGANGGTTFIDEIGSAISSSGATTSSTQIKFGNASLLTNTAGSYISTPNSTRNWFGNSAFTLEGWMYPTSTGAGNQLWQSKTNKFLSQGWGLYHGSASTTSNDWRFFMGNSAVNSTDAFTIPLNTWTHVAIQRYTNGTVFIYLNGNYTTSKAMVGNYDTSNPYRIGRQGTGVVSNSFIGYTDEARGSNVVRWYANFTPPTEAYRDGQLNPDTNLFSTLRFKTDPINTARITNQTGGGVRNRTIQIQNVNGVSHIIGSMTFDQEHLLVKNIYLNKSVWTDATLVSSFINNQIGYVEFNVTRAGGFSPDATRSSFLDTEMLYWNYTPTGASSSSFFGYGVVINSTTGTSYPIHNFIETVLTYTDWDFYPDFTSDVTTGNVPLTVQFTDTTIGYPNRWDWDWGDGEHTNWTTQNPTHVYTTPGLYTVTLNGTIWQNTSVMNSTTKIAYINATVPPAPVASFTHLPVSGVEPLSVQFTDTSTNTPDQWGWFFTNVTPGNNTIIQFSTLKNPLKIFGFGNYTIKLNATNVYGSNVSTQVSWVNASVYVPPLMPPVAAFSADDTSICQNATVTFTDASTNIPNAWLWEFGDGNTSILQNPTNTYYSLGQFTVNLRATNDDGFDWENKTNYITVNDCTPIPPVLQCVDAAGDIPVALSGSTYSSLNWTWEASDVTKVSLDGVFLNADIDNSSPFLNTQGFSGDTWHMFKIYNVTDYGRLNCKTNASALGGQVDVYPVSQTPVSPIIPCIGLIITGIIILYRKRGEI